MGLTKMLEEKHKEAIKLARKKRVYVSEELLFVIRQRWSRETASMGPSGTVEYALQKMMKQ